MKNKKGIFFTSIVIVILSLFLISYTFYNLAQERKTIQKRVETMNTYLSTIEEDMTRQLHISGFRIIFLFERRIIQTNAPIDNFFLRFNETFFNGTVYGQNGPDIDAIMFGATYNGIIQKLNQYSSKINVVVAFSEPILNISQDDPWNVKVSLTVNLSMRDINNLASWNKTQTFIAYVPVEGFEDPIYILAGSNVPNVIKKTPYSPINSSNIDLHVNSTVSHYTNNTDAPSFIYRLEGNFSGNPNGIESLVYTLSQSSPIAERSVVDHLYFSSGSADGSQTAEMPLWMYLDNPHCQLYGFSC